MKINLIELFKYYRSALSLENIPTEIEQTRIKKIEQIQFIKDIKSEFDKCKVKQDIFKFKLSKPFDKYILISLPDDDKKYNECFEELTFLEKTLSYCEKNKSAKLDTYSALEKNQKFVLQENTSFQYHIFFHLIDSGDKKNNNLMPLFILTFKPVDLDNNPISIDILFEQIKKCMGRNYNLDIDKNNLPSPILFINPYIIEEYECADFNFEFTSLEKTLKNINLYIEENKLLSENISKIKLGSFLCAVNPNMSKGLIRIYDHVIKHGCNNLLNKYFLIHPNKISNIPTDHINKQDIFTSTDVINAYSNHYGAFDSQFPLANTQRVALSCFLNNRNHILPINGAPGTGKTSLLRCIFGQYTVDAAIESYQTYKESKYISFKTPIVCSSTNNQALFNISEGIEAGFSEQIKKNPENLLYKRWLNYIIESSDRNKGDNTSYSSDKKKSIDFSIQLFIPSIKTFADHHLELNKFDLTTIVNNIKDKNKDYLINFNEFNPGYLDITLSPVEQLKKCADYFYQKIVDNCKLIKDAAQGNIDFNSLAEFEKYILTKYVKAKIPISSIKDSLSIITKNILIYHDNINILTNTEQELKNFEDNIENILIQSNKLFQQFSNHHNKVNLDQIISILNNYKDNIKSTPIYSELLQKLFDNLYENKQFALEVEYSNNISFCKSSSNVLDKILYFFKSGNLHKKLLELNAELSQKRKHLQQKVMSEAEDKATISVQKQINEALDEIQKYKINYDFMLSENDKLINKIKQLEKLITRNVDLEIMDIKKLVQFQKVYHTLDEITTRQLNLDTNERTDNFYYALHLIEALFFIKYNSSEIVCPNCKNSNLTKPHDKDYYVCRKCNAMHSLKNSKNKELSELELENILRFQGYSIKDKFYEVICKNENGKTWINITSTKENTSSINFNTLLPIFPMINITCNSFGSMVADSDKKVPEDIFDFVLVDEAGTIPPSKMIILYCAKKCMLFGDARQLKPVFNYKAPIELNLISQYIEDNDSKKIANEYFSCASHDKDSRNANNAILIGNNCCQIILPYNSSKLEGDIWLKEHFRCKDPIIAISNELTYKGEIIPKAGNDGHILFVESVGFKNSDNANLAESDMIVKFIQSEKDKLCELLKTPNLSDKDYYNSIGIITPFKGQEYQIIKDLESSTIKTTLTVGTVHKFQGSERKIIIFSTVYGDTEVPQNLFFNREDTSMINVAVTRAKNIFICFGRYKLLNRKGTHSKFMVENMSQYKN